MKTKEAVSVIYPIQKSVKYKDIIFDLKLIITGADQDSFAAEIQVASEDKRYTFQGFLSFNNAEDFKAKLVRLMDSHFDDVKHSQAISDLEQWNGSLEGIKY